MLTRSHLSQVIFIHSADLMEVDLIVIFKDALTVDGVTYSLACRSESCLRGQGLFLNSTGAHTVPFNTGRVCQVLVNGFCSALQWTGPPSHSSLCPAVTVDQVLPPAWCWSDSRVHYHRPWQWHTPQFVCADNAANCYVYWITFSVCLTFLSVVVGESYLLHVSWCIIDKSM